jgi:REP element-mobilizing transposase RayT
MMRFPLKNFLYEISIFPRQNVMSNRKSIRLKGYDYSEEGAYFITICVNHRLRLFWKNDVVGGGENIVSGENTVSPMRNDVSGENMVSPVRDDAVRAIPCNRPDHPHNRPDNKNYLNDIGLMIDKWWQKMFEKYSNEILMDEYVIMPNHIHGIIIISGENIGGENTVSPMRNDVSGENTVSPVRDDAVRAIPCNRPNSKGENMVSPMRNDVSGENTVSPVRDDAVGAIPCNRPNHPHNRPDHPCNRPIKIPNTYAGIGQYISWFKRMSTNEYIRNMKTNNWPPFDKKLWQRNYYEHIIRHEYDWYFTA